MLSHLLSQRTAVIGDLIASRSASDRAQLHHELLDALASANEATRPAEAMAPTVGDEFQGVFHTLTDALRATLLVRAAMPTRHDVRFGLGVGAVLHLDAGEDGRSPRQDGPGWWAAREAVEYVASSEGRRTVPKTLRTWISIAPTDGPLSAWAVEAIEDEAVHALNAFLVTRDHLVSAMDDRDRRILRGLLLGTATVAIAEQEGVSPSAISQRSQRSGAVAIAFAHGTFQ